MNRHGRLFLLCLVVALAAGGTTYATTSRIQALGGNGAFYEDEGNVLRWTGSLIDYSGAVFIETGAFNLYTGYHDLAMRPSSGPSAGLHLGLGRDDGQGVVALYLQGRNRNTAFAADPRGYLAGSATAIYAREIGPAACAVEVRHGRTSLEDRFDDRADSPRLDQDLTETEAGLGFRLDLSEGAYLDLAGAVRWTGTEESRSVPDAVLVDYGSESGNRYELRSRLFWSLAENLALVPVLEWMDTDTPRAAVPFWSIPSVDHYLIRVGCGVNYFPDTDRFLFASAEYRGGESSFSTAFAPGIDTVEDWDWDEVHVDAGAETRLLAWLTLRASCHWNYSSSSNSAQTGGAAAEYWEWDGVRLAGNLGLGAHLGRWDLDLAMTNKVPDTPKGFIGYGQGLDEQRWLIATLRFGL